VSDTESKNQKSFLKALDDFWFGHGSPTTLGLFRIFIGLLSLINLVMISLDWDAWFSEIGYVPAWVGRLFAGGNTPVWWGSSASIPKTDILMGITDSRVAVAIYAATTFFALTTTLGLWTRVSTIALAIGVVSMHHRNELILHGGDTVVRVMGLYLAISPCGRACSLDRLIRIWKGKEQGPPPNISLWPQRLVMYNMALIYFTTVWLKWGGSLWRNGTATWYPARLAEFYRFPVPAFVNNVPMIYISTYGTLVIEFSLATLVFYRPARKWVLLSGLLLHGWIEYSMNIPLFGWLMVSMYICFYDGDEVEAWAKRMGQRLKGWASRVYLPLDRQLDTRGQVFFDAVDPFGLVSYVPGEMPALDPVEVRKAGIRSIGAWVFAWIPGLWRRLLAASLVPTIASTPDRTDVKPKKTIKT
jgi:hypothetical protein